MKKGKKREKRESACLIGLKVEEVFLLKFGIYQTLSVWVCPLGQSSSPLRLKRNQQLVTNV